MSSKRLSLRVVQTTVMVVQPAPLGLAHQAFVQDALFDTAADWSVDLHGFCTEQATLILLPDGGDDIFGPSFMISREGFGYRLDEVHWDETRELGLYSELSDLVEMIRGRLTGTGNVTGSRAYKLLH